MSVNCAACGTCYTQTEGTELGGIELQRSRFFFFFEVWGGGGGGESGDIVRLWGHPPTLGASNGPLAYTFTR